MRLFGAHVVIFPWVFAVARCFDLVEHPAGVPDRSFLIEILDAARSRSFPSPPNESRRIAGGFRSVWGDLFESRRDPSGHRAEADAVAVALAPAGDDHVVAILQERAPATACQRQRLLTVPGQLQQAAEAVRFRAADRARTHQVADPGVAA